MAKGEFGDKDSQVVCIPGSGDTIRVIAPDPDFPFVARDHYLQKVMPLFDKVRILGQGASCEVAHVIRKEDNQEFAMKIMKRDDKWNPILFKQEYELLTMLDHPNILSFKDSYMDKNNFYFCTELCKGGELFDKIKEMKKFSEVEAASYIKTISSAIGHCHSMNIVHRDLKPENIVFRTEAHKEIVIIDFGDAKVITEDGTYEDFVGTAFYLAPECVRVRTGAELKKSDMWTIGVITYVLLTGRPPFYGNDNKEILKKIIRSRISFPKSTKLSSTAKDFIRRLIEKRPKARYSAAKALKHNWLTGKAGTENLGVNVLESISNYSSVSRLKKVLVKMLASKLTPSDQRALKHQFDKMDTDGDGVITLEELTNHLAKQSGDYEEAKRTAVHIIEQIDHDGDNKVSRKDWCNARLSTKLQDDEIIRDQFNRIDNNGDGFISQDELAKLFKGQLSDELIKQMIAEVDKDDDGKIGYDEFAAAMKEGSIQKILSPRVKLKEEMPTLRKELLEEKIELD